MARDPVGRALAAASPGALKALGITHAAAHRLFQRGRLPSRRHHAEPLARALSAASGIPYEELLPPPAVQGAKRRRK